jgi:glycosyltransferase involved in cell wall biosynthesis
MRVAVVTHAARKIGGTETYIEELLPALESAGHSVAAVFEFDGDITRPPIRIPSRTQCWSVQDHGAAVALMRLVTWNPDIVYVHGLEDPNFEARVQQLAPSVFYAHNYYGQCISGTKCHQRLRQTPCTRTFGPGCLAHYLPRGCGGSSPITMVRRYTLQKRRLDLLRRYQRVLTNSQFVAAGLAQQGVAADCLYLFARNSLAAPLTGQSALPPEGHPWRLLFLGRADPVKGGDLLLKALPRAAENLDRPLALTVAAAGPSLPDWRRIADAVRSDRVEIDFIGWNTKAEDLFLESHLLLMPSIWPEPFGLSGIEAGFHAVPAVAFASGGIPEWLSDGQNGYLARSDPPTADNLAAAIARALCDREHYLQLRTNALRHAREFSMSRHMSALLGIFEQLARSPVAAESELVAG